MTATTAECRHWIGADRRYCRALDAVRPYLTGLRCPLHTPAALAGRAESPPGPGWQAGAWSTPSPQSASALFDQRAVASGKRRSSARTYRAAQQAVRERKS